MKKIASLILAITLLSGCATQTYIINDNAKSNPDRYMLQPFFVYGIGQEIIINAPEICGGADKVAKVESELGFIDGFLGFVTFGIYTPRTARVFCTK